MSKTANILPKVRKPRAKSVKPKIVKRKKEIPLLPANLSEYITRVYSKYKKINYKILDELKDKFIASNTRIADKEFGQYPLQIISISKNSITSDSVKISDRSEKNLKLVKDAIEYAKKHKLPIPTTKLYIWVSDSHPYYIPLMYKKFPILTYCTPSNMDYILFPDDTFDCLQINQKYRGECAPFDVIKELIIANQVSKKIDKIYFKGTPTTDRQSRLREDLEVVASTSDKVIIKLDAWQSYEPLYEWCKYKYLLNLPGRYPWSNRLNYIFFMKSVVINVDTYTVGRDYTDGPYKTFMNLIVQPDVDYINIETTYNNRVRPGANPTKEFIAEQHEENLLVYKKILAKAKSMTAAKYNKMVKSAYEKVSMLNSDLISLYIYNLIIANAKVI